MARPTLVAEEPARKFVDELRARGYFELAVEYLDRLASSPLLPEELRDTISYEQGVTLVAGVLAQREYRVREKQLLSAHTKFAEFLEKHSDHELASSARIQQAKIQFDRGKIRLLRAEARTTTAEEKTSLNHEAKELFQDAMQLFATNQDEIKKLLQGFPEPGDDQTLFKKRAELRTNYVLVRFQSALVQFESAKSLELSEEESVALYNDALTRFESIGKAYRTRLRGIESVYYQGLCLKALGNTPEALGRFRELFDVNEDDVDLRLLKTKALAESISIWISPEENKIDPAIAAGEEWLKTQRPDERQDADWNFLKLTLARAFATKSSNEGNDVQSLAKARRLSSEVAKVRGPHQRDAQELLVKWGRAKQQETSKPLPKTFADATEAAREIRNQVQMATTTTALLTPRLSVVKDPAERKKIEEKIKEAQSQLDELQRREIDLLRLAIELADESVSADQINELRYQQCYFYYLSGDDMRASVLGEFIGRRFPDATGSRQSMRIALAALARFNAKSELKDEQVSRRIVDVAKQIKSFWPKTKEAEAALTALVDSSIQLGDYEAAEKYLSEIPENSPTLGDSEIATGYAIWNAYGTLRQTADAKDQAELESIRARAIKLLNRGIDRKKSRDLTLSTIQALLVIAQSYMESQAYEDALKILDDEKTGPHALTVANHAIMRVPGLRERSIQLAIQAYIGSIRDASTAESKMGLAVKGLDDLKQLYVDAGRSEAALVGEYIKLAAKLELQIQKAPDNAKLAIARGYEKVLGQIAGSTNEINTLIWSTQSLSELGESLVKQQGDARLEGTRILNAAVALYEELLKSNELDEKKKTSIRFRVALSHRHLGDFEAAINQLATLLGHDERQVIMQMEAARTFQMWGEQQNRKEAFARAIAGDREITAQRRNLIWGWGSLSQKLGRSPAHRELFHEARYNLAYCRFAYANRIPSEHRSKHLKMAKNDLVFTARLYPKLGGERWKSEYDALLKQVQTALGEKPLGLAALKSTKKKK